eukprot:TRINITY_DN277_c1_g1_i2.p1 TRINITY_DN277_c1_g1~~TRINITY_DN277_c1_g1_i2.p1  ORF type:complete len:1246 (-),score=325.80 TRINITY_DN277_c1_g1_i2:3495-7193(-)
MAEQQGAAAAVAALKRAAEQQQGGGTSTMLEALWGVECAVRAQGATPEELRPCVGVLFQCFGVLAAPPQIRVVAKLVVILMDKIRELTPPKVARNLFTVLGSSKTPTSRVAALTTLSAILKTKGMELVPLIPDIEGQVTKQLKANETPVREAALDTLAALIKGCGASVAHLHADFTKVLKKQLQDKLPEIRLKAAQCFVVLCEQPAPDYAAYETRFTLCVKLLDDQKDNVREEGATCLSVLLQNPQKPPQQAGQASKAAAAASAKEAATGRRPGAAPGGTVRENLTTACNTINALFVRPGVRKELRAALALVYLKFLQSLHGADVDSNTDLIVAALIRLTRTRGAYTSPSEALQACACVKFALASFAVGLREVQQQRMAKVLAHELQREGEQADVAHLAALRVLCAVVGEVGESMTDIADWLTEPVTKLLDSPNAYVRAQAAACLRAISAAVPSQAATLIQQSLTALTDLKAPATAAELPQFLCSMRGRSSAVAALLAGVPSAPLGVPGKLLRSAFDTALRMRDEAAQQHADPRLADARSEACWKIIAALLSTGPAFASPFITQAVAAVAAGLGGGAAPSARGDVSHFAAQRTCTLWAATALGTHCADALGDAGMAALQQPLADTLSALISAVSAGPPTTALEPLQLLTLNLLRTFACLPRAQAPCLRALLSVSLPNVKEGPASTLLRRLLSADDAPLGPWREDDDGLFAEPLDVFVCEAQDAAVTWERSPDAASHQPVPLATQVVDAAILLLQSAFASQEQRARAGILAQLEAVLRAPASPSSHGATSANVLCALLAAVKAVHERRLPLQPECASAAFELAQKFVGDPDAGLRRGAGEAVGLLCRFADQLTAPAVKTLSRTIEASREEPNLRAGCAFALGCIQRYVGGMRASAHLGTFVPLLHAMSRELSPVASQWAVHALCLAVDAAGPAAQPQQTLALLTALFQSPSHTSSMPALRLLGRLMNAVVGAVGPDLVPGSGVFRLCSIILDEIKSAPHPLVQLESILFYQRLILFAPQAVVPSTFAPFLQAQLASPWLLVRQAAVTCLRQLVQAPQQWDLGVLILQLATQLFSMLDSESDRKLLNEGELLLGTMVEKLSPKAPAQWLALLKDIILTTHSTTKDRVITMNAASEELATEAPTDVPEAEEVQPQSIMSDEEMRDGPQTELVPRWRTKVFTLECLRKLLTTVRALPGSDPHFDLIQASKLESPPSGAGQVGTYLVFGLADLAKVR